MPFFCTPQPSRRDAVITPPVIYLPGVIGNIVTYAGRDMSAGRTKFCSTRRGTKTEQESNTVQWREGDRREGDDQTVWQKCFFGRKLPHFPLFLTWSYLVVMPDLTTPTIDWVTERSAWRNLLSDITIQVTVIRLLSLGYSQNVTVNRLLPSGYVTVVTLLPWGYCQQVLL